MPASGWGMRHLPVTRPPGRLSRKTPTLPTDWRTVGLLALALLGYLVLIERAGFIIASAVLFVMAAFAMGSRRLARDIAIGIVMSTALYLVFSRGLGLSLPPGILMGIV